MRAATWAKAKRPKEYGVVLDTFRKPSLGVVLAASKKSRTVEDWKAPAGGEMKFNLDGAAKGCPGEAGIGGVRRDERSDVKIIFSKAIGVDDSNLAEVMAIR